MGVGGQPHFTAASTPGKDPVLIVQEAGWAPGPVWKGQKFSSPPGFFNFFYIHIYYLITVTFHFSPFSTFQELGGLAAIFVLSVTLLPFYHPSSLPTLMLLKLVCH